eukprot:4668165-Prymnesium_polylepis.1
MVARAKQLQLLVEAVHIYHRAWRVWVLGWHTRAAWRGVARCVLCAAPAGPVILVFLTTTTVASSSARVVVYTSELGLSWSRASTRLDSGGGESAMYTIGKRKCKKKRCARCEMRSPMQAHVAHTLSYRGAAHGECKQDSNADR